MRNTSRVLTAAAVVVRWILAPSAVLAQPTVREVVNNYANIAQAAFEDSLVTARTLASVLAEAKG